jgi:hypothetical protein
MYDDRNYHIHDDFWNHRHIDATSSGGKKHLEVTYMVLLVEKSMNVWLTGFAVSKKIWTRPIAKNWIILHTRTAQMDPLILCVAWAVGPLIQAHCSQHC